MINGNIHSGELDLQVHDNDGPIYGNKMICQGVNTFYITDAEGSDEERMQGEIIKIDGNVQFFQSISEFGFSLSDFEHVPVGTDGLKVVAYYDNFQLVLTANGLFVLYEDGIPSLQGLPSSLDIISGMYVDTDGFVKIPRMSLFTHSQLASYALMFAPMSFRKFDLRAIDSVHWCRARRTGTQLLGEHNPSRPYALEVYSSFEQYYPKFTQSEYDGFKTLHENHAHGVSGGLTFLTATPDKQSREQLKELRELDGSQVDIPGSIGSTISTDFRKRD